MGHGICAMWEMGMEMVRCGRWGMIGWGRVRFVYLRLGVCEIFGDGHMWNCDVGLMKVVGWMGDREMWYMMYLVCWGCVDVEGYYGGLEHDGV